MSSPPPGRAPFAFANSRRQIATRVCRWVVLNIDPENKKRIIVSASGRTGLEKMKAALQPDQVRVA